MELSSNLRPLFVSVDGADLLIAPGRASGPGWWYENDSPLRLPVDLPIGTAFRVVLRLDYGKQSINVLIVYGPYGCGELPALIRWPLLIEDASLAVGTVTLGGPIVINSSEGLILEELSPAEALSSSREDDSFRNSPEESPTAS